MSWFNWRGEKNKTEQTNEKKKTQPKQREASRCTGETNSQRIPRLRLGYLTTAWTHPTQRTLINCREMTTGMCCKYSLFCLVMLIPCTTAKSEWFWNRDTVCLHQLHLSLKKRDVTTKACENGPQSVCSTGPDTELQTRHRVAAPPRSCFCEQSTHVPWRMCE